MIRKLREWHHPLWQLWWTRTLEELRDGSIPMVVLPILVIGGLGLAFRPSEEPRVRVAVVSASPSDEALQALGASPDLEVVRVSAEEATARLHQGTVAAVYTPSPTPELLADTSHPQARLAQQLVKDALERQRGRVDTVHLSTRTVTTPGKRYVDFLVPGLLGFVLLGAAMSTAGYLVEDRARKLLKRYAATPMRRSDYLIGLALSRVVMTLLMLPVYALIGYLMFKVTIRGHPLSLVLFASFGMLMLCGLGFILGSRAPRTEVTHSLMTLVQMPQAFLCGVFFSIERFPPWLQSAVSFLPLSAYVNGLRALMNDGAPLTAVAGQAAILAAWGIPATLLSLKLFRWQ